MDPTSHITKEEILSSVVKTMNEVLDVPQENITEHARLTEDLGADSLEAVEVMMALEDKFGMRFEDMNRNEILTVEDIVNYVSRQLTNSGQHSGGEVA